MTDKKNFMSRRAALAQTAGAAGLSAIFKMTEGSAAAQTRGGPAGQAGAPSRGAGGRGRGSVTYGAINKYSSPSDLRISDLRAVALAANYEYDIVRMDTNQGVYGLGEGTGVLKALADAKPRVVGRNPLDITAILADLQTSTAHILMSDAHSVLDMCLHDLAGKVFGVPAWRLLGDKKQDRIRMYCDTTEANDPKLYGARMLARKKLGFTFFKMDIGPGIIRHRPGAVNTRGVATAKGLEMYGEHFQAVRDAIGWDQPLAADHFGPLNVSDSIRHARSFEKYELMWAEDILQVGTLGRGDSPRNWRAYKQIQDATCTPLAMGEGLFGLEESFKPFVDNRAVSVLHLDPQNCGGLREMKRIADYADDTQGIPIAVHMLGSPVMALAAVHSLCTLKNFLAMEVHAVDFLSWWTQLVTGVHQPVIDQGYITVPDVPGIGLELNEPVLKEHLYRPGWFEPITEENAPAHVGDGQVPWPHFNLDGQWVTSLEQ